MQLNNALEQTLHKPHHLDEDSLKKRLAQQFSQTNFEQVKKDCGAKTTISIDAGHNNISFDVTPSKKHPKNIYDFPKGGGPLGKVS